MHIDRWDIDRTYLDSAISSVRGLLRTAMESADSKRSIPGAQQLVQSLQAAAPTNKLCLLSGSPTQMEQVLRDKFAADGVRIDWLVLKDNLRNLKRRRLRAVTSQIGYKLPTLLRLREGLGVSVHETLFGDDTEADAAIYCAYREAIAGRLAPAGLARFLEFGGAYPDQIDAALKSLDGIELGAEVDHIYIHLDARSPPDRFRCLGSGILPVYTWFQAAVHLHIQGRISLDDVERVRTATHPADEMKLGWLQDLVRRGHVTATQIIEMYPDEPAVLQAVSAVPPTTPEMGKPDLIGFLRG